jgi:hypothetical protein
MGVEPGRNTLYQFSLLSRNGLTLRFQEFLHGVSECVITGLLLTFS